MPRKFVTPVLIKAWILDYQLVTALSHIQHFLIAEYCWQMKAFGSREAYASWAGSVDQKVLVMYGSGDCITPLSKAKDAISSTFEHCELRSIEGSSHQLMQEKPQEVNAAILQYIDQL